MGVKPVNSLDELNQELSSAGDKLVVVDFFATWCGPCKMMAPKLEKMTEEFPDVVFLKADADEADDAAEHYEVSALPTFMLFKNKERVGQPIMGAKEDELRNKIKETK
eukprot:gb/GECG01005374.1/.p1 GENE.gb/GECG01005374.1/~~gb/GECG01005374.1/.p1  ORF type:complete len:108 (+),score=23.01 gb/GECG01005374.1/:1-324(+)